MCRFNLEVLEKFQTTLGRLYDVILSQDDERKFDSKCMKFCTDLLWDVYIQLGGDTKILHHSKTSLLRHFVRDDKENFGLKML